MPERMNIAVSICPPEPENVQRSSSCGAPRAAPNTAKHIIMFTHAWPSKVRISSIPVPL